MAEKMNLSRAPSVGESLEYRGKRMLAEDTLKQIKLPGWYYDCRGVLCITTGQYLLSLFVDADGDIDEPYSVTVDYPDSAGCLSESVFWESYSECKTAVQKALGLYKELAKGNFRVLVQ